MNGPIIWQRKDYPGVIWIYPKQTPPDGTWLLCDGTEYQTKDYPELANALGVPPDQETFQVPNLEPLDGAYYIINTGRDLTPPAGS